MKKVPEAKDKIEKMIEEIIREYDLDCGEAAWILLSLGLNYYLMDMTRRQYNENQNNSRRIRGNT